jgi:hypothetical protein
MARQTALARLYRVAAACTVTRPGGLKRASGREMMRAGLMLGKAQYLSGVESVAPMGHCVSAARFDVCSTGQGFMQQVMS